MKTIVLDIDGTICSQENPENYAFAEPIQEMIDKINEYYDLGYIILFETSRHMLLRETTEEWLERWNVKYHYIFYGKPVGDYYVDSKNKSIKQFLNGEL